MSEIESIISQLETINESLVEVAMNIIREAIENGSESKNPDKVVSQARRSVAKAIEQLRSLDDQ